MKNKILLIWVLAAVLIVWSCNEKSPVAPDFVNQNKTLDKKVAVGTVTPLLDLNKSAVPDFPPAAPGDSPEGIAIDKSGNMYISNTRGVDRSINEILRVTPNGIAEVYATLPGSGHARGLAIDNRGNVYVAFADNPDKKGVYRIRHNRNPKRLEGSKNIGSPNALTFDSKGNLYCTSSLYEDSEFGGAIWRFGKEQTFERWFMSQYLDGASHHVAGVLVGANGIVFYPPNKLYVANTSQNSISCIIIGKNDQPIGVEWSKSDFLLMNIDGIAVDVNENIYGVLPASTLNNIPGGFGPPPLPPLVMLNPSSQMVTPVVVIADAYNFNTPTSLAFGTGGSWNRKSVYIANAGLFYGQSHVPWSNPGVVEAYVGTPGQP